MIRYKFCCSSATTIAVECAVRGYPNKDADGEIQYDNTHFDDQADAWRKLIVELDAGVSLGGRARARAEKELKELTVELAEDAQRLVTARDAFHRWQIETISTPTPPIGTGEP